MTPHFLEFVFYPSYMSYMSVGGGRLQCVVVRFVEGAGWGEYLLTGVGMCAERGLSLILRGTLR